MLDEYRGRMTNAAHFPRHGIGLCRGCSGTAAVYIHPRLGTRCVFNDVHIPVTA